MGKAQIRIFCQDYTRGSRIKQVERELESHLVLGDQLLQSVYEKKSTLRDLQCQWPHGAFLRSWV